MTSALSIAAGASAGTLVQLDVPVPPLVRICGVSKSYSRGDQRVSVLNDVTFDIPDGKFLGLMGPSGSGKSTLLNLIAAIDRPDHGRLIVNGADITELSEAKLADWRAANIGFIFQFYNLLPALTAEENVELPLLLTPLSRRERQEHVAHSLKLVGLTDRQRHYPSQLSGGQQQRVAIARAIVTNPVLLVADEPTGDLDRGSAADILTLLETLKDELGLTIVMVTHDPRAAERADAVMQLEKGQLYRNDERTGGGAHLAQLSCNY